MIFFWNDNSVIKEAKNEFVFDSVTKYCYNEYV